MKNISKFKISDYIAFILLLVAITLLIYSVFFNFNIGNLVVSILVIASILIGRWEIKKKKR